MTDPRRASPSPDHPLGPDPDGALLFLEVAEETYDISVDREELEALSREIERYYETLDERLATIDESEESREDREFYADRMYM
jgi:predicted ATP-grasp superfamily ATP-dependent carboligase